MICQGALPANGFAKITELNALAVFDFVKNCNSIKNFPARFFLAGKFLLFTLLVLNFFVLPLWAQDEFPYSQNDLDVLTVIAEMNDPDGALGSWLSDNYALFTGVTWCSIAGEQRVCELKLINLGLEGELEITALPYLKRLELYGNKISALKITDAPHLEKIAAKSNQLIDLYTDCLSNLKYLELADNHLRVVPLENTPNLATLDISQNPAADIEPGSLPLLEFFYAEESPVPYFDLSQNPHLLSFKHTGPQVMRADVSRNPKLLSLDLNASQIYHLDLKNNTRLNSLKISGPISELDLSHNKNLEYLDVSNSKLTRLDRLPPKLLSLSLWNTKIETLDLAQLAELVALDVSYSGLESLDLSQNIILSKLFVSGTPLADFANISFPSLTGPKTIKCLGLDLSQYQIFDFTILSGLKELFIFDKSSQHKDFAANLTLNSQNLHSLSFDCEGIESLDLSSFKNLQSLSVLKSHLEEIILGESQLPFKGQAILEENRLPLSELLPFADPQYFATIGPQEDLFFERLKVGRNFDLGPFLQNEWVIGGVATEFQFLDAQNEQATDNCQLSPNGRLKCQPGQYYLEMQNPLILNIYNAPVTATTGVLEVE